MVNSGNSPTDDQKKKPGNATGNYPTGSLSNLVPKQTGPRPKLGSMTNQQQVSSTGSDPQVNDTGSQQQDNGTGTHQQLNDELQQGLLAREAAQAEARRRQKYTDELNTIVRKTASGAKTTGSLMKPVAVDINDVLSRQKKFAAWKTFGISMMALALLCVCALAARHVSIQTEGKRAYIVGRQLQKDGKYDLAIESYARSLRMLPDNSQAYFCKGMCNLHTRNYETAINDFERVLSITPDRVAAIAGKSFAYLKMKDYDKTIMTTGFALAASPTDTNSLLLRSIAYSRKGQLESALKDCDTIIEAHPRSGLPQAYANRAFIFFKMGQVLAAIRDYRQAIKLSPENAVLYSNLAQCLKRKGDVAGAIIESKACLERDAHDLPSLMLLGECYLQTGQPKEAIKYYERAVAMTPAVETYRRRADAYMALGRFHLAFNDLDRVLRAHPTDGDALRKRSICRDNVLRREGVLAARKLGAEEKSEEKKADEPTVKLSNNFDELLQQGYSLMQKGSSESAVQALTQAVKQDPRHAVARQYLAYALAQNGDYETAAGQFAQLERLQPLGRKDLFVYAKSLAGAHNSSDAAKLYRQLLIYDPSSFEARTGLIQAYIDAQQPQAAADAANNGILQARSESEKETYRSLLKSAQKTSTSDQ